MKNSKKYLFLSSSFLVILSIVLVSSLTEAIVNQCVTEPFTAITSNQGRVKFPASGKFVLESHLATTSDSFPNGELFPNTVTQNIQTHLNNSCQEIKKINAAVDCATVYRTGFHKKWTPAEGGGKYGQGSVGNLKPFIREEMFGGNMMWAGSNKPKPGTKFLVSYGGKNVVVVMGYETGPGDKKWLGGFQGEVFYFLQANDESIIKIEKLKDQNFSPGPIECQSSNINSRK